MTLTLAQKTIKFGDGSAGTGQFATDGTNYWPVHLLATEQGVLITDSTGLPVTPVPSEVHIGAVGGNIAKFQTQFGPAASTTYAAGQCISGVIPLTNMARVANGSGIIVSATLVLAVANTASIDILLFSSLPAGTYTAGSAPSFASGDALKSMETIHLSDWTALSSTYSAGKPSAGPQTYTCDDTTNTTNLYAVLVVRGSVTLATATDATLTIRPARN